MKVFKGKIFKDLNISQEEVNIFLLEKLIESDLNEVKILFKGLIMDITLSQISKDSKEEEYSTNKLMFFIAFIEEYKDLLDTDIYDYSKEIKKELNKKTRICVAMNRSIESYV